MRPLPIILTLPLLLALACSSGNSNCPVLLQPGADATADLGVPPDVVASPDLMEPADFYEPADADLVAQDTALPDVIPPQDATPEIEIIPADSLDTFPVDVADLSDGFAADVEDTSAEVWEDAMQGGIDGDVAEDIWPDIAPETGTPIFNEVGCHKDDFVELVNLSDEYPVFLAGFALSDNPFDPEKIWFIPGDPVIPPGGRFVLYRQTPEESGFTFGIGCGKDSVYLLDADGGVVDTATVPLFALGNTWGRLPDVTGEWQETASTPEAPNEPAFDLDGLLFDPFQVFQVDIELSDVSYESLKSDPYFYVPGTVTFTIADIPFESMEVGVRIKGQLGSKRPIDKKAAFKIKTNFSIKGQTFLGLKKFTLNNMVQDKAMLHEALAYNLFRAFGIPCPRTGYAWVTVNGNDYGLYANIESPDEIFLSRFYQATTHLFEGDYGSDVVPGEADELEIDEGGKIIADLMALIEAAQAPDDTWMETVAPVANLEQMVRMWVVEQYIGHWDGYAPTINNYYLHSDGDEVFTMLPWGVDQTFAQKRDFYKGKGHLFVRCLGIKECRDMYEAALVDFMPVLDSLDSVPFVESLAQYLAPYVEADPKREYTVQTVNNNVQSTINFLLDRRVQAGELTDCLSDPDADPDGDGYICQWDCNHEDPTIYFGAEEICGDGIDQSCSGMADDGYDCPDCVEVFQNTHRYLFCPVPRTYAEAAPHCAEEGADLAVITTPGENAWVLAQLATFDMKNPCIGLDDLTSEGNWLWVDGSSLDWENWNNNEPNNSGNEDCAQMLSASGKWNDIKCGNKYPLVCEDACLPGEDADDDGYSPCDGDCDDSDPTVGPDAVEICADGIDQDCDGVADQKPQCTGNIPLDVEPPVAGYAYFYYPASLKWQNARTQCQLEGVGADLAWFDTEEEFQAVLEAFLGANGAKPFWVGLNDLAEEGTWTWADGSPLLYEYWNANEPNDYGTGEDCGQVLASGKWNDIPCGYTFWALCKMPAL